MATRLESIPFDPDRELLFRRLHLSPGSSEAEEFEALLSRVRDAARPKALYDVCFVQERTDESVTINGVVFTSRVLRLNLEHVYRVFPYVATCGVEFDRVTLSEESLLYTFWLDAIKEAALMAANRHLKSHIEKTYQPGKLSSMNPGSSTQDVWPIDQQHALFSLFGDVEGGIGVTLHKSCLMSPNKSISGIFFPTELDYENCKLCSREKCEGRRASYSPELAKKLGK